MSFSNTAVVGAGTMGNGIAHVLALNGYTVTLIDVNEAALKQGTETIASNLQRQVNKERITDEERTATLDRIRTHTDLAKAVSDVELVIEAVSETTEVKGPIFETLDEAAPDDAILASNTSSISITWLAAQTTRPEQGTLTRATPRS
ncbi:MAG: 3-hydroxyacyl-CoA dehydrogenase NAD-binding domain-containing protein [Longimonas sp.]|uniref:3-hydroxyacyl-CoA dehydrogenase family protein n=1 Tax=Longimonas sp. TaxID=2039626 RepID=UPI003975299B